MASVICALTLTGTASTSTISQTAESARKSVNVSLEKQSLGFVEGDHFSVENTAAFQGLVHQFISVTNASKGEFILLFQLFFCFSQYSFYEKLALHFTSLGFGSSVIWKNLLERKACGSASLI